MPESALSPSASGASGDPVMRRRPAGAGRGRPEAGDRFQETEPNRRRQKEFSSVATRQSVLHMQGVTDTTLTHRPVSLPAICFIQRIVSKLKIKDNFDE